MELLKKTYEYFWFVGCFLCFLACKRDGNISLGTDEPGMGAEIADSLTVEASTFLLDPLPTAATGSLLLGGLQNADLGKTTISSYFRVGISTLNLTLPDDAVFDSAALVLHYNQYYYGDTSQLQQLRLYRLTENLELTELSSSLEDDELPIFVSSATLWADRQFEHEATPLGSVSFKPRPLSINDTVKMRVNDELGNTLFNMVRDNDARLTNADDFADYLKGFVLKPAGDGGCITGFRDSVLLNVYYSYERQSDGRRVQDTLSFTQNESAYQYNAVQTERNGTALAALLNKRSEVPAVQTGNHTYIQGSTGIVTRLRFPTVKEFVNQSNLAVSQAQLIIETPQSTHQLYGPPQVLNLMVANKYGTPTSLLQASYGSGTQSAYMQAGDAGGSNAKYVFNLTQYVSDLRNSASNYADASILLTMPVANLMNTVNQLVVAAGPDRPAITLRILYVKF